MGQRPPADVPPSPISPCHSRHSSGTYTPPLLPSAEVCGLVPSQSQGLLPASNNAQVPTITSIGNLAPMYTPPIFARVDATLEANKGISHPLAQHPLAPPTQPPPVTNGPPSNLGKPLFSFPSSFNMVPISSALDTMHVRSNPFVSPDASPQDVKSANITHVSSFQSANLATEGPLPFTPSPTSADNNATLPARTASQRSPILNRTCPNSNGHKLYTPPPLNSCGRNSPVFSPVSAPNMSGSPASTPPSGRSASSSPRSSTPVNGYHSEHTSRRNSEDFDSKEGMNTTIEALEETIVKCSDILKVYIMRKFENLNI